VGPARMFAESLTPSPGIREHYLGQSGLGPDRLAASPFDPQRSEALSRSDACLKFVRSLKRMYPNSDTLGERLKLYVEENFPD
jgi:hypothetical protein